MTRATRSRHTFSYFFHFSICLKIIKINVINSTKYFAKFCIGLEGLQKLQEVFHKFMTNFASNINCYKRIP